MRLTHVARGERGDTIIEVIFAIVIFALVAVSCLSIMNKGVITGERALEVTLARQQMDAQAEALRYLRHAHYAQLTAAPGVPSDWMDLIDDYGTPSASPYGAPTGTCVLPNGSYRPFILNARKAQVAPSPPIMAPTPSSGLPPYPQVLYDASSNVQNAYGLWIEAVPSSSVELTRFVDFHIRACWDGPGGSVPITLGTIVRLYDPR